ncbi:hypothetical protein KKH43_06890 [Patescibacteria group bacterium]|nr:hypothetical protein [Patescibacteria group bacterium]
MKNPEDTQKEVQPQEAEKTVQPQSEKPPSEIRNERLTQINQELEVFNHQTSSPEEIQQIQEQREQEYQSKVVELEEGLGTKLGQESTDMIHQNMVDSTIKQAQRDNERLDNLQRLKKVAETLSPEDFLYFEKILGNQEGRVDQFYDLKGKVLHTTNDFNFGRMLESGNIKTGSDQEGMYSSRGASFTDGDFSEAASFQTLYEDQNTHSSDKKLNSQDYGDKVENFVRYFWDNKQEETRQYLSKISGDKKVDTFEDALKIAEGFKFKAKPKELENDPETLSKLYGLTIVFEEDKLQDLTKEGTEGLQRDFELRSYRKGGVPLSEASTVFVPESQIENMRQTLQEYGLTHIDIRPSEELEAIRIVKLLEKK